MSKVSTDPAGDLSRAVAEFISKYQPSESAIQFLADWLTVPGLTIERWSKGVNLPHHATAKGLLEAVKDFQHFQHLLSMISASYPLDGHRRIAHALGVSFPTVERWFARENAPHPAMMGPAIQELEALLPRDREY